MKFGTAVQHLRQMPLLTSESEGQNRRIESLPLAIDQLWV